MKKLFLDDLRKPPDNTWDVVRNYDAFVAYIEKNGVPDIISFDHDLGVEHYESTGRGYNEGGIPYNSYTEKTGYDCAKWLVVHGFMPKKYFIHSMNPVGRQNIEFIMRQAREHIFYE